MWLVVQYWDQWPVSFWNSIRLSVKHKGTKYFFIFVFILVCFAWLDFPWQDRGIDTAVANNDVPSKAQELPILLKKVHFAAM